MKSGFTLIELIFTIILIALLASIAIPKFSATRDDALTSTILSNLADCVTYAGSKYTATGRTSLDTPTCDMAKKCFDIEYGDNSETNGSIVVKSGSGVSDAEDKDERYCKRAYILADRNGLSSSDGKVHSVGATVAIYDK